MKIQINRPIVTVRSLHNLSHVISLILLDKLFLRTRRYNDSPYYACVINGSFLIKPRKSRRLFVVNLSCPQTDDFSPSFDFSRAGSDIAVPKDK